MLIFYDMDQGGKVDVNTIMTRLSLALKATVADLVVAIPAIMIYNALLRKVDVLIEKWREYKDMEKQQHEAFCKLTLSLSLILYWYC